MPEILERESYDLWLDPGMQDTAAAQDLLKAYDAALMRSYPISTRINNVGNDDSECGRPIHTRSSSAESVIEMKKPTIRVTKWLRDIPSEATCTACPDISFREQGTSHRPGREEYQRSLQMQFDAHSLATHPHDERQED